MTETISVENSKIGGLACTVDPDEAALCEPPYLDLCFLQSQLLNFLLASALRIKMSVGIKKRRNSRSWTRIKPISICLVSVSG